MVFIKTKRDNNYPRKKSSLAIPGTAEKLSYGAFYDSSISTLIFSEDSDLFFPTQTFIYSLINRNELNGSMTITNSYFLFDLQNVVTIILPEDFEYTNIYQYDDHYNNKKRVHFDSFFIVSLF